MGGEAYIQREKFFFLYLLPGARGVITLAPPSKLVRDTSDRLRVPRSTAILCTLSKTDRVVLITWSSSGYPPVRPEWPDAPSSSCLLIKMWQLTKADGVSRNEPKMVYNICSWHHAAFLLSFREKQIWKSSGDIWKSLLIATQNNTLKTNYVKAKIDDI